MPDPKALFDSWCAANGYPDKRLATTQPDKLAADLVQQGLTPHAGPLEEWATLERTGWAILQRYNDAGTLPGQEPTSWETELRAMANGPVAQFTIRLLMARGPNADTTYYAMQAARNRPEVQARLWAERGGAAAPAKVARVTIDYADGRREVVE